jgi:hypothetical protein
MEEYEKILNTESFLSKTKTHLYNYMKITAMDLSGLF